MSPIFVVMATSALGVTAFFVFLIGRNRSLNRLTPLAALAFILVFAGILAGQDRWLGYALMTAGVLAAILDIVERSRRF